MLIEKVLLKTDSGIVKASAPLIVSASRATDVPAFYGEWFMNRLRAGYAKKRNPFSGKEEFISFEKARAFVFWTKNPAPFLKYLPLIEDMGYTYYFLYTLNDYEKEGFEKNIPHVPERVKSFIELSGIAGKDRVIWRFDPIALGNGLNVGTVLDRIGGVGEKLKDHTDKLIFSFVQIDEYRKVKKNTAGTGLRELTMDEKSQAAYGIGKLAAQWRIQAATCADERDYSEYGIIHNACIDAALINRIMKGAGVSGLTHGVDSLFGAEEDQNKLKDKGQRKECLCAAGRDIGAYNTCPHGCVYCYANASHDRAGIYSSHEHDNRRESLI